MTIANGQLITAADLNAMTTSALALIQADNARLSGVVNHCYTSFNIVAGTSPLLRTWRFVVPVDTIVDWVLLQGCQHTNPSTTTIDITADGAAGAFPIAVTGATGTSGRVRIASSYFDNAVTNVANDFSTTSRVLRVWPKGTTVTVVITTTNAVVASSIGINICGRSFYSRGNA
jgi:hypothetical protein